MKTFPYKVFHKLGSLVSSLLSMDISAVVEGTLCYIALTPPGWTTVNITYDITYITYEPKVMDLNIKHKKYSSS